VRHPILCLTLLTAFGPPALAGGTRLAGGDLEIASTLTAEKSSVSLDPARGRSGGRAVRWHGVGWESRLEFLKARNADFEKAERFSLWIHTGSFRGETVTIIAGSDPDLKNGSFSCPVQLGWEGWHRVELPKLRFVRSGPILWPQVKHLFIEYRDYAVENGELLLDDIRLLAPGERAVDPVSPAAGGEPTSEGEKQMLADFEKAAKSLVAWVTRDSKAQISIEKARHGRWALRWFDLKRGASLEFLQGPFSVEGYDRFLVWIYVRRGLGRDLWVAYGNDADRIAVSSVGTLDPGWNEVILPLDGFRVKGDINTIYVEHLMFLYEGEGNVDLVLDDVCFIASPGTEPPPRPTRPPVDPGPGPSATDEGQDVTLCGEGVSARPQAAGSKALRCTESWYVRDRGRSIKWYALGEDAELHFHNVPPDPDAYGKIDMWIYADNPTGVLEVTLGGDGGEAWRTLDVDWIGWKHLVLDLDSFQGMRGLGRWREIYFRIQARPKDLREFYFDRITIRK